MCLIHCILFLQAIGTLEELAMPQNGINLPGIKALVEAVAANPKLRVLNLNDNTFTETGAQEMAQVGCLELVWLCCISVVMTMLCITWAFLVVCWSVELFV
jgi:hypothetical protein